MLEDLSTIDFGRMIGLAAHLGFAYVLAIPIGWDREAHAESAGLRTFPLVALASCAYIMLGIQALGGGPEPQARVLYGLMTGMGFIGGGAILKDGGTVRGTATAASIWNTGAIGAAVAWRQYEIAIVLSVVNYLTLCGFRPLKRAAKNGRGGARAKAAE